jgi:hypothetical protein
VSAGHESRRAYVYACACDPVLPRLCPVTIAVHFPGSLTVFMNLSGSRSVILYLALYLYTCPVSARLTVVVDLSGSLTIPCIYLET